MKLVVLSLLLEGGNKKERLPVIQYVVSKQALTPFALGNPSASLFLYRYKIYDMIVTDVSCLQTMICYIIKPRGSLN